MLLLTLWRKFYVLLRVYRISDAWYCFSGVITKSLVEILCVTESYCWINDARY
jgi:hypothetical protein